MHDLLRFADHLAGGLQHVHDCGLCLIHRLPCELCIPFAADVAVQTLWWVVHDTPVTTDDGASWQLQLTPPDDVGEVTERADHGDARALVDLCKWMRKDRYLDIEQRRAHGGAKERLVTLIVRVGNKGDARRYKNRTRRFDDDVAGAVGLVKCDCVVCTRSLSVFKFGLCDRCAEVDVPECRCFLRVCLTPLQVAQEGALRNTARAIIDGGVQIFPINRQTELAEQILEHFFVLSSELFAQLDEVRSRHRNGLVIFRRVAPKRWVKVRLVRDRWVA